jgi:hypothetical protein
MNFRLYSNKKVFSTLFDIVNMIPSISLLPFVEMRWLYQKYV